MADHAVLPVSEIDPDPANVRRQQASDEAHAGLRLSMSTTGLLQPIVVRPDRGRYRIVAGHRRFRAAKELGWREIDCMVVSAPQITDIPDAAWAATVQTVENTVRSGMSPLDQWRAARTMMDAGASRSAAASALGIPERMFGQMEVLGRMAPPILDALAMIPPRHFPGPMALRRIAAESIDHQTEAAAAAARDGLQGEELVERVLRILSRTRIPAERAIFDLNLMTWDVDLFAEPGSPEETTTADVEQFMRHQTNALRARVQAEQTEYACMMRDEAGDVGEQVWIDPAKRCAKRGKRLELWYVVSAGYQIGAVQRMVVEKPTKKRGSAAPQDGSPAAQDSDEGAVDRPVASKTAAPDLSGIGRMKVAAAREVAILGAMADTQDPTILLAAVLMTAAGDNFDITGTKPTEPNTWMAPWGKSRAHMIGWMCNKAAANDGQTFAEVVANAARDFVRSFLISPSRATPKHSGVVDNWVGALLEAGVYLPRFDTPDILEHLSTAALARHCDAVGEPRGNKAKMVERLAGMLPDWLPDGAPFDSAARDPQVDYDNPTGEPTDED